MHALGIKRSIQIKYTVRYFQNILMGYFYIFESEILKES